MYKRKLEEASLDDYVKTAEAAAQASLFDINDIGKRVFEASVSRASTGPTGPIAACPRAGDGIAAGLALVPAAILPRYRSYQLHCACGDGS